MTTTLKIEGMSCMNCVKHATEALTQVPGVKSAEVILTPGQATVDHDDAVAIPDLIGALAEEGYTAEVR